MVRSYQHKMISGILNASSFREVRNCIDAALSKLKGQDAKESHIITLIGDTLKELKKLNEAKLPYDQHANIISAEVHLTELQLQAFNVIN